MLTCSSQPMSTIMGVYVQAAHTLPVLLLALQASVAATCMQDSHQAQLPGPHLNAQQRHREHLIRRSWT